MDVVYSYSHLGGEEILLVRYPELYRDIEGAVAEIANPGRTKTSQEKTMKGRALYAPKRLNQLLKDGFRRRGWREVRDKFTIEIPAYPHRITNAYKQCDFYKDPVIVEVQFGKYAFMFYDLAKFQYFYNRGFIQVGVEIVPCHFLQQQMSSGVSYGEQLVYDLERLSKNFPSVPVRIVLVDMPLGSDNYLEDGRRQVREAYKEVRKMIRRWSEPRQTGR